MPYFSSPPHADVHHFLCWNWLNSRISARGWVTLLSFVCQQACLFFSEGVGFSGLLNQMGRVMPGSVPDTRNGGLNRHKKSKKDEGRWRQGSIGDALLLPVHLLGLWVAMVRQWMCRDRCLPLISQKWWWKLAYYGKIWGLTAVCSCRCHCHVCKPLQKERLFLFSFPKSLSSDLHCDCDLADYWTVRWSWYDSSKIILTLIISCFLSKPFSCPGEPFFRAHHIVSVYSFDASVSLVSKFWFSVCFISVFQFPLASH